MAISMLDSEWQNKNHWGPPLVQWVVKISKHCNLRCRYCYEYPFLAQTQKMEIEQLEQMFLHIATYYQHQQRKMDFVWHGGEPLLIDLDYYRSIFALQERIFTPLGLAYSNSLQTNLTLLNEPILEALKNKEFHNIGVSIDLFGDERVNIAGKCVQNKVLQNMQRLKDAEVLFGCIMVLSQKTMPHIEKIYSFFEEIDTSFRILPIYRTGFNGQHQENSVSPEEILSTYKLVFDKWLASEDSIQVRPVQDYVVNVLRYINNHAVENRFYDKLQAEVVYIVDTNGDLFSNADAYDPTLCYGNIFKKSLHDIFSSFGYSNAVGSAHKRMIATCYQCHYFGACSGYYMGEATPDQRWINSNGDLTCEVVKPFQDYILSQLEAAGLVDELTWRYSDEMQIDQGCIE